MVVEDNLRVVVVVEDNLVVVVVEDMLVEVVEQGTLVEEGNLQAVVEGMLVAGDTQQGVAGTLAGDTEEGSQRREGTLVLHILVQDRDQQHSQWGSQWGRTRLVEDTLVGGILGGILVGGSRGSRDSLTLFVCLSLTKNYVEGANDEV